MGGRDGEGACLATSAIPGIQTGPWGELSLKAQALPAPPAGGQQAPGGRPAGGMSTEPPVLPRPLLWAWGPSAGEEGAAPAPAGLSRS